MAIRFLQSFRRASLTLRKFSPSDSYCFRSISRYPKLKFSFFRAFVPSNLWNPSWVFRNLSHGSVNLVISEGKTKFEIHEVEPPKKEKWKKKKQLKMQRMREKKKRKAANKKDPRHLGIKGKKKKFQNAGERLKFKIEKAKIKEALLIEKLKRYEVPKLQGPVVEQENLTGEERFYLKKMAQKRSNYVPVGRRGVFGGVVLNMHLHWKKHETVEVICKPCKPGQIQEYAKDIARLSGGIPIQIIGNDTIIFYRGKTYVQPRVMSPIDTLSKKKALEKSKYEQSLDSVRHYIAVAEKELELYNRHIALYGDPSSRSTNATLESPGKGSGNHIETCVDSKCEGFSTDLSDVEVEAESQGLSETGETEASSEDEKLLDSEVDYENDEFESSDGENSTIQSCSSSVSGSNSILGSRQDSENDDIQGTRTMNSYPLNLSQ